MQWTLIMENKTIRTKQIKKGVRQNNDKANIKTVGAFLTFKLVTSLLWKIVDMSNQVKTL